MSSVQYDIAIIGAGLAGIQLALALARDSWSSDKSILLLDKDSKNRNDRTWSFWEAGEGKWDDILSGSWDKAWFKGPDQSIKLDLSPYTYKTLRGIDFYNYSREQLSDHKQIHWIQDECHSVIQSKNGFQIIGEHSQYYAKEIFDSRMPHEFIEKKHQNTYLLQHFKGRVVTSNEALFDPEAVTMMNFADTSPGLTHFIYILPFSSQKALIEYTVFSNRLLTEAEYDRQLNEYIGKKFPSNSLETMEEEFGVIPMTDFPFHTYHRPGWNLIGTAGGWVKPSTGYAFKNSERNAAIIVDNLKKGKRAYSGIHSSRRRFLDRIFLNLLDVENEQGPQIFQQMYLRNPVARIFRFLDEESSIWDELRIISGFTPWPFLRALSQVLRK